MPNFEVLNSKCTFGNFLITVFNTLPLPFHFATKVREAFVDKLPLIHLSGIMFLGKNHAISVTFIKVTLKTDVFRAVLKHKDVGEKMMTCNPEF